MVDTVVRLPAEALEGAGRCRFKHRPDPDAPVRGGGKAALRRIGGLLVVCRRNTGSSPLPTPLPRALPVAGARGGALHGIAAMTAVAGGGAGPGLC